MADHARILVVAATSRELAAPDGWRTLCCGVGPVEAAATTAAAIAEYNPQAILHVGIAGARRESQIAPATLVIGTEARYCDLMPADWAPTVVVPSMVLLSASMRVLPSAPQRPIGTSARIGGTSGCDVEAMEGFSVLRAAQLAGVPAIEIRAISNEIEESDRTRWRYDDAFSAITSATPLLVAEFMRSVGRA